MAPSRGCIILWFTAWTISGTECAPARNADSWPAEKSIDHWRAWRTELCGSTEWWTHWTVVSSIWFICCRALLVAYAFVRFSIVGYIQRCNGRPTVTKVTLANNQFSFQDKMDVILYENTFTIAHYSTPCVSFFFKEQLITKGTIFIRPSRNGI